MAVTAKWYGIGARECFKAGLNWPSDTVKVALTTASYTPNQDTHDYFDDVTNEVSGGGYTAGGISLANKACTYDTSTNTVILDADDITWGGVTLTARYGIVYRSTGTASTSLLLGYIDFGADQSVSAADFKITWDAVGVLKAVAA